MHSVDVIVFFFTVIVIVRVYLKIYLFEILFDNCEIILTIVKLLKFLNLNYLNTQKIKTKKKTRFNCKQNKSIITCLQFKITAKMRVIKERK